MEFISEGIFGKYSKIKILGFDIFENSNFKTDNFFKEKFNGSICAYRVFYLPIFRRIEGVGVDFGFFP